MEFGAWLQLTGVEARKMYLREGKYTSEEGRNGTGKDGSGNGQIGGHYLISYTLILQFMVKSQQSWIVSNFRSGEQKSCLYKMPPKPLK